MPIIGPDRGGQKKFSPPRPSEAYPLTRSHQLPILQNDRVNNLPADQTFPSPELFLEAVKLVIDHGARAAKTFRKKQSIHLNLLHSYRVENGVEHHFIGLFEKVHRTPEYPKALRLQVAFKILPGIPFLKKKEFIYILRTLTKVATVASPLRPDGDDQ